MPKATSAVSPIGVSAGRAALAAVADHDLRDEAGQRLDESVDVPHALAGCWRGGRSSPIGAAEEVGQGESRADLGVGAARVSTGEPVAGQHALLEALGPGDHRRTGRVLRPDRHVDVARDPGLLLELVQVVERLQVRGCEVTDVGLHAGAGARDPAADREQQPGRQHPPGAGDRHGDRGDAGRLEPGGRPAGGPVGLAAAPGPASIRARPRARAPPSPPVSATTNARATPITRSSPNERTSGLGERAKTAKPAIVATHAAPITGPPPAAAAATARPGAAPSALASLKRAWNWIA